MSAASWKQAQISDGEDVPGSRYVPSIFKLQFMKPQSSTSLVVNSILINVIPHRCKEQCTLKTKPYMSLRTPNSPAAVPHILFTQQY